MPLPNVTARVRTTISGPLYQGGGIKVTKNGSAYTVAHDNSNLGVLNAADGAYVTVQKSDGSIYKAVIGQNGGLATTGNTVIKGRTNVSDANHTISLDDVFVAMVALTAARTWTLPAASLYDSGQPLYVADESGNCSATNTITLQAVGSDTIAGATAIAMTGPYQKLVLHSNGSNLWTYA